MFNIIEREFLNLPLTAKQKEQLEIYYNFLIEKNKVMNLTAIIDKKEVYIKHFLDSLLLFKDYRFENNSNVCDVGSGAGFPGIVLKILYPNFKLTIIEALSKRCGFLQELVSKLQLKDVTILHARAEEYSNNYPERFDYIISRAVATLSLLLELVVKLVKVNGTIICYKGPNVNSEIKQAHKAISTLSLELVKINHYNILELGERNICFFLKLKSTDKKYPRSFAQIKKSPIE